MWKDRQYLEKMKRQKQKERERMTWSSIRMLAKRKMINAKKKRTARVQMLNEKLRNGDWDYEV